MRSGNLRRTLGIAACMMMVLALSGCTIRIVPGGDDGGPTPPPAGTIITVRMVNSTSYPLDPQMYVGDAGAGLAGLFASQNKRTDFGLGSIGVMVPGSTASFTVECGTPSLIATAGGAAGDDLNSPTAQGAPVVLEEDLNLRCDDVVTFTFRLVGGELVVTFAVESG